MISFLRKMVGMTLLLNLQQQFLRMIRIFNQVDIKGQILIRNADFLLDISGCQNSCGCLIIRIFQLDVEN